MGIDCLSEAGKSKLYGRPRVGDTFTEKAQQQHLANGITVQQLVAAGCLLHEVAAGSRTHEVPAEDNSCVAAKGKIGDIVHVDDEDANPLVIQIAEGILQEDSPCARRRRNRKRTCKCAKCGIVLMKSEYSSNQWHKCREGERRCTDCIELDKNARSTRQASMKVEGDGAERQRQQKLHEAREARAKPLEEHRRHPRQKKSEWQHSVPRKRQRLSFEATCNTFAPAALQQVEASQGASSSNRGRSRFPRPAWACNMVSHLKNDLEARLLGRGLGLRPLRIGTDCSGADAPIFALDEIAPEVRAAIGVDLSIEHVFACDILGASRAFIVMNGSPLAMFPDLVNRQSVAPCLLKRGMRVVPSDLDIYVAGFPCKDFSMLNHNRPCLAGPHAAVFDGVVQYIERHEPCVFVLENVKALAQKRRGAKAPIDDVMKRLRSIPNYKVHAWTVNTMDFYLPQNRPRVYIVGVNTKKAKLKNSFPEWAKLLDELRADSSSQAHQWLLNDDEPEILEERARLRSRPQKAYPASYFEQTQDGNSRVCQHGTKWIRKHVRVRRMLGLAPPQTRETRGWTAYLTARGSDVLELLRGRISRKSHVPLENTSIVGEISRGYSYASLQNIAPCVTPSGCLWFFSRWRWAIGKEKLALQGFPVDDLNLDGLAEGELSTLAGNAMSVPVIGAFLSLVLASVEFPDSPISYPEASSCDVRPEAVSDSMYRPRKRLLSKTVIRNVEWVHNHTR
jgi:DNA-cytosine methyltransferase